MIKHLNLNLQDPLKGRHIIWRHPLSTDPIIQARQFISALPHCKELNMNVDEVGPGNASLSMPYDERLIGDPATGVIHGGAVSALMDTCCGAAVIAHPKAGFATATLGLRIDYMRAATPGQSIRAIAECHHVSKNVAFVRASAFDDDSDNPVATASGSFTVERKS